jgi:hypothetical protein
VSMLFTRWCLRCVLSVAVCALATVPGCRRSDTVSVFGQVTLDGAPLTTGTMAISPMDQTAGPAVGCEIVDGRYEIPATRGARRGTEYRVEIRSIDPSSGSTKDPRSGGVFPVYKDRIPPAYNSESQLTLSVSADADQVRQDFQLQSKVRR